ncbi:MAG TPA: Npt1/Npt2 family nucleotide transporter [Candidatus Sulfotelmatobacter sp.]|nr:Npt1/Npt2 family nucleotide transporter [Candidatus Sulfotelmatobacter sp.]
MTRWLEGVLNVRSGDLGLGFPLSLSLFLTISAYVIGKVARDALFLAHFSAVGLPYADIASGVIVGVVVVLYLRIGRRISFSTLLVGSPIFFASNCFLFWVLTHYSRPQWLYPIFYVWVSMFGVLAPTQVWTLANHLLTTREAKRVFGMVGGGGILGWVVGGGLSTLIAKHFGTESLLLAMVVLLALCGGFMQIACKGGRMNLNSPKDTAGTEQKHLRESMRSVASSPYLRAIAVVICISSCVTTLTGWQFKALAKQFSGGKDAMAIFFGDFFLYAGILALLFQLLLTTRLLRRFGIGPMLFILPLAVLGGSIGLLIWGTIGAALFVKGGDQVLRYSIDRSTTELLYLPLPKQVKVQAKWFIDTVVWRVGDGLAGLVVLLFAAKLRWTPQQISWIATVLVTGWIAAVFIAGREYVTVLRESISQHRLSAEQASTLALDRSTADLLAQRVNSSDPEEILYALSLFEVERERAAHPVIRGLMHHPVPAVRQKAISVLSAVRDKSVTREMEGLLRDSDAGVRTEAMLYLVYHSHVDPLNLLSEIGDYADYSVRSAMAAYLARPGEAQNVETAHQILLAMSRESGQEGQRTRLEVARLLGDLPDYFDPILGDLLDDPDPAVVHEAVRSVGRLRKLNLAPRLLECLSTEESGEPAAEALVGFGDAIVPLLDAKLGDCSCSLVARRAIPGILSKIATPVAAAPICNHLLEEDAALRFKMISALNKIHRWHPEIPLDIQLIETVLAAEIMGHYRSYQIQEALKLPQNSDESVTHALEQSMEHERERIFRLLGLLYPHLELQSVYFALQSKDPAIYDNALELLESALKVQLRTVLVPLLDGKVSPTERAAIGERLVRTRVENREQAVAELIGSSDPWLKSCGAYAIGTFAMRSLEGELGRCLEHPDPLLRETARQAQLRLNTVAQST